MSEYADRYRRIAAGFTARVENVPEGRWDSPAPPKGWVARDVVKHLTGWIPGFFGLEVDGPSADEDPVGAWAAANAAIQAALDDPERAGAPVDSPMADTVEELVDRIGTSDVLVHTWDLARATGQDETLDPDEVHRMLVGMEPFDEMIRGEHFGPRVPVPDDADEQARLIAFTGRRPF